MAAPMSRCSLRILAISRYRHVVRLPLLSSLSVVRAARPLAERPLCTDEGEGKKKLDGKLARPGGARGKREAALKKAQPAAAEGEGGVPPELLQAVDAVAQALQPDPVVTRSDLLRRLQEHAITPAQTGATTEKKSSVSFMFAGMKVESGDRPYDSPRSRQSGAAPPSSRQSGVAPLRYDSPRSRQGGAAPPSRGDEQGQGQQEGLRGGSRRLRGGGRAGIMGQEEGTSVGEGRGREQRAWRGDEGDRGRERRSEQGAGSRTQRDTGDDRVTDIKLFDGPDLGIFTKKPAPGGAAVTGGVGPQSIFDAIEAEEAGRRMNLPPNNAFDEMMRWTREGKLWTFPIDNDQGWVEEEGVGFHEHVFLEPLLEGGRFPPRGPVRNFMDLVVVGLTKNPYLSVRDKQAHIAWYAEYFSDKYHLFEDSGAGAAVMPRLDIATKDSTA